MESSLTIPADVERIVFLFYTPELTKTLTKEDLRIILFRKNDKVFFNGYALNFKPKEQWTKTMKILCPENPSEKDEFRIAALEEYYKLINFKGWTIWNETLLFEILWLLYKNDPRLLNQSMLRISGSDKSDAYLDIFNIVNVNKEIALNIKIDLTVPNLSKEISYKMDKLLDKVNES